MANDIEHCGPMRVPASRTEARHPWDIRRAIASGPAPHSPSHSHHHIHAAKPFWRLEAEPEGPTYSHSYMTMIVISLMPPPWRRIVDPLLAAWDRDAMGGAERAMLAGTG